MISQIVKKGALVKENEIILTQQVGVEGINGKTVKGKVIEVPVTNTTTIQPSKNIKSEKEKDTETLYSTVDGMVSYYTDSGQIQVAPYQDASFDIEISEDKMEVKLVLHPSKGEGQTIDPKMIEGMLESKGIMINSIARQKIKNLVTMINKDNSGKLEDIILTGAEPIHGKDGKIVYLKKTKNPHFPSSTVNIDYAKALGAVDVKENQIIGYMVKPTTDTKNGYNVFGDILPAKKGEDVKMKLGEGLFVDESSLKIKATKDGILTLSFGTPQIVELEEITPPTQDVNFDKAILIKASLEEPLKITSKHDIFVYGSAKNIEFESGGNVIITGIVDNCGIKSKGIYWCLFSRIFHFSFREINRS